MNNYDINGEPADNGLNAARGILYALPISCALWALIIIFAFAAGAGIAFAAGWVR